MFLETLTHGQNSETIELDVFDFELDWIGLSIGVAVLCYAPRPAWLSLMS